MKIPCIVTDEGAQINMELLYWGTHIRTMELPRGEWTHLNETVGICRRLDGSGEIIKVFPESIVIPDEYSDQLK